MVGKAKKSDSKNHGSINYEKFVKNLSDHEARELLLINMYKVAILKSQVEAITSVLIKHRLATYDEIWKETEKNVEDMSERII